MTEFVSVTPRFSKAEGGNIRIELLQTACNGAINTLLDFVMPRQTFTSSVKDAMSFLALLQREEAEEHIASLPRGRTRREVV